MALFVKHFSNLVVWDCGMDKDGKPVMIERIICPDLSQKSIAQYLEK